ncbi:hypothetical protein GCM10007916_14850 [Psychromonas marina]|uniref:Uncharacterized protein n=1 Tax=Psychromonas marina TaxID=88364 RepID=A0ABQ6DZW0_9GAMM|nr:hypothetical protein [Psychromonas marina]GLS90418.1 hypothetical protein GCM10007916_14850 [Psychromonas marina]
MANHRILLSVICSLLVWGCEDSTSEPNNNATDLGQVYTYREHTLATPQRDPASCVNYSRSCSVAELPFIAISYPEPDIQQIMSRVVVSHDWMGARFESLLAVLPEHILTLLGSVTAIVIANNIRPSFYWTGSGAIYLDPAALWLTNTEKLDIDKTEDYRDGFSNGLRYNFFHRFVKDDQPAYYRYSLTSDVERDIDDIIIPVASLLFHELAHANDFMPISLMPSLNMNATTSSEINRFSDIRLNEQLTQNYPINDAVLTAQSMILYRGQQATEERKLDTASELGALFEQEGANHLYAYSQQAEDVAMLFQATMLSYYYDIKMDSAFVIQPEIDSNSCSDYTVSWGQRHRIADPISKPRTQFISQQILPNIDFNDFFEQLASPQSFPSLTSWCNISLTESATENIQTRSAQKNTIEALKKDHHHGALPLIK